MDLPFASGTMLGFALAVAFAAAGASYLGLGLGLSRGGRIAVLAPLWGVILATPLLVPQEHPFGRWIASVIAFVMAVKVYDLYVWAGRGHRLSLREFAWFLINVISIVHRKLDAEPRPSRIENLERLARGCLGFAAGVMVMGAVFQTDWRRLPFAVEHCAKVVALFLALLPASAAIVAAWRLLGMPARDWMNNPFASRTPADFWRRYNRVVQQFFDEDVFKPIGGRRMPVRATLVIFTISAIIHECLFWCAIGQIQGYQVAFFLIQGFATAATLRVRPRGWRALAWGAATLAFNLATSTLFFASVDQMVPFYLRRGDRGV